MTVIGYHASHEQHTPRELLLAVQLAEAVGFDAAMCSDHLAPWTCAQGESGFAWAWLGAALASTDLPIGVVTAPGQRYHPVVLAQAIATLEQMFPGRFWAALGSGEALNEHVTGEAWPPKADRQTRLAESVDAMRRLLRGNRVSADGEVRIDDARVWSRPDRPPPLLAAAVSAQTATWAAGWGEGLITVGCRPEETSQVREAYRAAGGRGEVMLQIHVSLGGSAQEAISAAAEQWAHATAPADRIWDIAQPEEFLRLSDPTEEKLREAVLIEHDPERLAAGIAAAAQGFDHVYVHHVGADQEEFLQRCGRLLPALRAML